MSKSLHLIALEIIEKALNTRLSAVRKTNLNWTDMTHAEQIKRLEDEETLLKSRLKAITREILTLNSQKLKLIRGGRDE